MISRFIEGADTSGRSWHPIDWYRSRRNGGVSEILRGLSRQLARELNGQLEGLQNFSDPAAITAAMHLAIDDLSNTRAAIERNLRPHATLGPECVLALLDEQIANARVTLSNGMVADCVQASLVASRTLNLLFCARQSIKQEFLVLTPSLWAEDQIRNRAPVVPPETETLPLPTPLKHSTIPRLIIPSSLLYQLHQALFPAEKMMIGAGRRNGDTISIEAVFEVTGRASAVHVQADPDKLGRALIAMSETDTYFAWWIHSHPGKGCEGTIPSQIDRDQEIDWLNDYSPELVSSIMVRDRFIQFWGRALDDKRIRVEVAGPGVDKENTANLYRLEC